MPRTCGSCCGRRQRSIAYHGGRGAASTKSFRNMDGGAGVGAGLYNGVGALANLAPLAGRKRGVGDSEKSRGTDGPGTWRKTSDICGIF